jgi:hypothetical protein
MLMSRYLGGVPSFIKNAHDPGGIASDDGERWYILRHHRTSADDRSIADDDAGQYGGLKADPHVGNLLKVKVCCGCGQKELVLNPSRGVSSS